MRIALIALAAFALHAAPALAHPDHDDEEHEARTPQQTARDNVVRLISQAKLPASWSKATVAGTRERTSQGQRQTIVTFRNEAEPNAARKLFHVVLTAGGQFVLGDFRQP
ncbi:DUF6488 family protein [Sphingobium sp. SA2]|jgi:hypothetical protein|uniref:DUF3887 domain-containing protein n=2 Tax=Sphingomonadaceae TaxID=41297 RepID=A0A7X5ZXZ6_9SPHN|nr:MULTISPECIES: DUF6488 family protein [Sphingomonadaceae]MBN2974294.1 hypothetical protein [Roseomonas aeriglobus]MBQ8104736.1 hypothetical protein [Afipia sp.]OJY63307.1 MAG: hypothetical protein BGP16_18960 [Sphingobium sp. 66-54]KKW90225.1 hypothetical protein YP76_21200 [Sphingobium chungbukense]MBP8232421.1 hypothetical protein [Rhizorhabdus sp.]